MKNADSRADLPPARIETERFVLRCWSAKDARLFKSALDMSLEALQKWIPWARDEPSPLSLIEERLRQYHNDFNAGKNALYAMMDVDEREVLGGVGLYRRVGPGALEIGYWVRSDLAGMGLATAGTAALTNAGFSIPRISRIEIHCDPRNEPSAAIPRKLGYSLTEIRKDVETSSDDPERSTMVWTLSADEYELTWMRSI